MELSLAFWATLLVTCAAYWLLVRGREWVLLGASLAFLGTLAPWAVAAAVGLALVTYGSLIRGDLAGRKGGGRLDRRLVVLLVLGYLIWFKYAPPLTSALGVAPGLDVSPSVLPLGISYLTFKLLHVIIEVSRARISPGSLRDFLLYVMLFTTYPAGPIERLDHFMANRETRASTAMFAEGLTRIIHGLIKKFLVAETMLLPLVTAPRPTAVTFLTFPETYSAAALWAHLACWYLYAYLDFSAYTDIAVGTSRLFGFRVMENFNNPWLATNIGGFWQRWHMSLAQWCRSYVYMPLIGLSRNPYLATYATMITIGLWHKGSVNWLCWGLYHATGLVVYQTWQRVRRARGWESAAHPLTRNLARVLTFAFVTAGYAFVVTDHLGIGAAFRLLAKLAGV
jgi:alginate O-acetyltransferase complex protein AlgI